MRIVLGVLSITSITSIAAAEHVPTLNAELVTTPGLSEIRGGVLAFGVKYVDIECARFDHIENDADVRGSFLGVAFRLDRPDWGVWIGTHIVSVWTDSYRYFTPSVGLRVGAGSIVARSTGLFAGAVENHHGRSGTRDFDIDARVSELGDFELRGRFRDIDMGADHFRDLFVGVGITGALIQRERASVPIFVGFGLRRELWRDGDDVSARIVDETPHDQPTWQGLVWLEVGLGVVRVH